MASGVEEEWDILSGHTEEGDILPRVASSQAKPSEEEGEGAPPTTVSIPPATIPAFQSLPPTIQTIHE